MGATREGWLYCRGLAFYFHVRHFQQFLGAVTYASKPHSCGSHVWLIQVQQYVSDRFAALTFVQRSLSGDGEAGRL